MNSAELSSYISKGEGLTVEFKRCGSQPGSDTFETVCSFANRQGGNIFLGITDDGTVTGVPIDAKQSIERNIANVCGNPNMFNPSPLIELEEIPVGDKLVIRIWVPMGPAVYRFKNVVYDRLADTDVRVSGVDQISLMYLRKQNSYSERRIYRYVTEDDLRPDLIARARQMAMHKSPNHPWGKMTDQDLLRSAKLYARDRNSGETGFTLAAVVLLGTDDVIGDILPAYKTDAIYRLSAESRYDDRLVVKTNLLDSYDALTEFAKRHLPDKFLLDGDKRVSARDIIIRELVCNLLIHREFISPFPAKLIIDSDGIRTENASRALFEGRLTLEDFNPMSKNPTIAAFFSTVGLAEDLGSGMRKLNEYSVPYSGKVPILEDGDVFRAFVPTATAASPALETLVISIIKRDGFLTSKSLATEEGTTARTAQRHIKRLLDDGLLVPSQNVPRAYVLGQQATGS